MAGHTPGPWDVYEFGAGSHLGIQQMRRRAGEASANIGRKIASVHNQDAGHDAGPEERANAQLLAAAPDLLELVLRAIRCLRSHLPPDGITETEAISELLGIFDGPEQRAAFEKAGIPNDTP